MTRAPMAFARWLLVTYDLTITDYHELTDDQQKRLVAEHQALIDAWEHEHKKAVQSEN